MTRASQRRPLPARAAPFPGESLVSLLRRTSEVMGYESPRRLLALLASQGQLPAHINALAPGETLDHLATLVRLSPKTLCSMTIHRYATNLILKRKRQQTPRTCDSKTAQRYFASCSPICPRCLQQDGVAYERLLWSFRPTAVCDVHGCLVISRCPDCGRSLRSDRMDITRCSCGAFLGDIRATVASPFGAGLASNFHQLLRGETAPLPGMSTAATFWWAGRLAAAVIKTPTWFANAAVRTNLEPAAHAEPIAWLAAAEILTDWPHRLETFLDAFQLVDKHQTTSTGVGRRFGMLLRHAAKLEEMGHPAPADALRHYLLERYDGGHLSEKVCLFKTSKTRRSLRQRTWVTQTSAARLLGLRPGAIASLIEGAILTGKLHPAGENGRSLGLVRQESVESLQRDLRTSIGVKATAIRLGIGPHAVLELIHLGVLPRVVRTAKGWRIPQNSLAKLESLFQQLPAGSRTSSKWISPREATCKFGPTGLTFGRLIEFVLNGELSARMVEPQRYLQGIVVSTGDLDSLVPRIRAQRASVRGYPLHQLAKVLFPNRPIKPIVLEKWITAGLIKADRIGRATVITAEEVERFRSVYCLADEVCRVLGISRATLSRWEVEDRIRPVYGKRVTPGAGFSLYRREDLENVSRRKSAARSHSP